MKRTLAFLILLFLTVAYSFAQLTLNHTKAVLAVGETLQLTATTTSGAAATNVTWGSYEDAIATVSSTGLITARKEGETIVYAQPADGYFISECLVQVVKAGGGEPTGEVLVKQITFPGMPSSMMAGQKLRLQASIAPEGATNKSLRWSLTGSGAYITGDVLFTTAAGEITVTAEALDGSRVQASFNVNVDANPNDPGVQEPLLSGTLVASKNQRCLTFDLGQRCVVKQVGYRKGSTGERMLLGVFEGANLPDFTDALPLHIIRTEPTQGGSMEYANVGTSRGFRYVRFKAPEGSQASAANVAFYGTPGEGDDSQFQQLTNLPTIVINTLNEAEPKDNVVNITSYISLISKQGTKILTDTAGIRLRGNSSKEFPKKPYRIKWDEKHHVLGSPAKDKKWVLINNYSDKSLIRNMIGFEVSRCFGMAYTPFCTMADVIVNGDYRGTYQLADKIELGKNRLDIPKFNDNVNDNDNSNADSGSYLVESDMCGNLEPSHFSTYYTEPDGYIQDIPWTVQYPDDDERTPAQYDYLKKQVDAMTQTCFNAPLAKNNTQLSTLNSQLSTVNSQLSTALDLPSFLRYFLIEEFAANSDGYWSMLMYKMPGESKWYSGPVWDFDIAFDNNLMCTPASEKSSFIYLNHGAASGMKFLVDAVMRALEPQYRTGGPIGTKVPQMLTDIWAEARYEGGLTEEHLLSYVDSLAEEILLSQDLNFKRWPILTTQVQQEPKNCLFPTFFEHIDYLKQYLSLRLRWMDEQLGYQGTPTYITPLINDNDNDNDNDDLREAKFQGMYDLGGRSHARHPQSGIVLQSGKKALWR